MARSALPGLLALGALGAFAAFLLRRRSSSGEKGESSTPEREAGAPEANEPTAQLTREQIEGKREYTHPTPAGYTRAIPKLPPEANSFARQALGKPYGTVIGPAVLSDGRTYIAVTESHFDDHVTNPRTGQKDKHWHKGASMFVQVG